MRLKVVVRRHKLPDTAIVWAIDPGDDPTISQLLEQVNEVVPLESSGDWGLEDYSVEIKGANTNYECLHFQLVKAILHEDDEVLVRPLLSQDLKFRKVGGRHQITSDGKHLYDGSVFGRRSVLDRPAIEIPPRKRRRITYYNKTDASSDDNLLAHEDRTHKTGDHEGNRQLVLRTEFDNVDFDDEDDEDDEDFEPEEEKNGEQEDEENSDETQDRSDNPAGTEEESEDDGQEFMNVKKQSGHQDVDITSSSDSSDVSSSGTSSDSSNDSSCELHEGSDGTRDVDDDESVSSDGSTSTSDATSNLDSDSDSEPDEVSSKTSVALRAQRGVQDTTASIETLSKGLGPKQNLPAPPGQGKKATRIRNERRRKNNILQRFQKNGVIPAGTTLAEFRKMNLHKFQTPKDSLQAQLKIGTQPPYISIERAERAADFEARRQQLLDSLASGGVDIGPHEPSGVLLPSSANPSNRALSPADGQYHPRSKATTTELDLSKEGDAAKDTPGESFQSRTDNTVLRPRRKVDLGAAGRLLFGALGIKPPKSQEDHEKVRHELNKDIRAPKSPNVTETIPETAQPVRLDKDPNAWRDFINLRAVECCHEGIELSPAPFPFVQRWDPQQQKSYNTKGNRRGRGKQSQRNQDQYYDEQHQGSKKRKHQNTISNSYEEHVLPGIARYGEEYDQNGEDYLDLWNDTEGQNMRFGDLEYGVNDQLMRDVQGANTSQDVDEDDLPQLPENISALSDLTAAIITTGMVIAFKQLILSEATNWQPEISAYRTAVVIVASKNGDLELTLAKRDREQREKHYDDETGQRIWGKFSMPTDDDEIDDIDDDDGLLSISFTELIEPKIVQAAPESLRSPKLSAEEPPANVSLTVNQNVRLDLEDSAKNSEDVMRDASTTAGGFGNNTQIDGKPVLENDVVEDESLRLAAISANNAKEINISISEDTRQEISDIIKEAGFRSSVPSSVTRAQPEPPAATHVDGHSSLNSYSPHFNGFSSSSPIEAISSPSCFNPATAAVEELPALEPHGDFLGTITGTPSVGYPKLSVPSSLASQVSDVGRQPDYSVPGESTLEALDNSNSFLGLREDFLGSNNLELPASQSANDGGHSVDHIYTPSPVKIHPPSSDCLRSPAEVFSTGRTPISPKEPQAENPGDSFQTEENPMSDSYDQAMAALDAQLDEDKEDPELVTPRASQRINRATSLERTEITVAARSRKIYKETAERAMLRASQQESKDQFVIPPGSQQIDLTLSSDAEPALESGDDGEDWSDEDLGLPSGPGWVEKKTRNTRRQSSAVPTRAASQPGSQRRATGRKT